MITKLDKNVVRKKRHQHVRRRVHGTSERPRLNVFRSSKHIYAQLIDDVNGHTLASASTLDKDLGLEKGSDVNAAKKVGEAIAAKGLEKGLTKVVFDRGGYLYHGRIQALAEAAREKGLEF
ncbi:50S ribosomal protein L18 [Camelliibacillus cellulosilyticus]|uniref:Large ribosomal subunit protein uL18 n=1 Tax=Camelliibacillus cellulosilyticus TaxID=2174486 RepID=A0ABV9GRT2_9BACL